MARGRFLNQNNYKGINVTYIFPQPAEVCTPEHPDQLWRLLSLLANAYSGFCPQGTKRPTGEADHSLPFNTEVKSCGAIPSLPRIPSQRSQRRLKLYTT